MVMMTTPVWVHLFCLLSLASSPHLGPAPVRIATMLGVAGAQSWEVRRTAAGVLGELLLRTNIRRVANTTPVKMVAVPGGTLRTCVRDGSCKSQEVKPFLMDETEVTAGHFSACVVAGKCEASHFDSHAASRFCNVGSPKRREHPANCVDFKAARQYCRFAGKRLPTLQEWQFAARGTGKARYPWGDSAPACDHVLFHDRQGRGCGKLYTQPVGFLPGGASPFGVLDMGGSIMEWTSTIALLPDDDPEGKTIPVEENKRTKRYHMGGSFADEGHVAAIDYLCFDSSKTKTVSLGLRCVKEPTSK